MIDFEIEPIPKASCLYVSEVMIAMEIPMLIMGEICCKDALARNIAK